MAGESKRPNERGAVRNHGGFTLIELMVVLLLIGILSAMILPEMRGTYGDALLRSSARDLVNVLSIASSRAVSLNQLHRVRISSATGRYEIERQLDDSGGQPEFAPLKDVSESAGKLDERITVEVRKPEGLDSDKAEEGRVSGTGEGAPDQRAPGAIMFYSDGTADAAEVVLRDRDGFGLRLRISPITARVEIRDLAPEHDQDH